MKNLNAADIAAKYAQRAAAAQPDYVKGVMAVQTAPGQLAAAAKEKMRAKINKSIDDGTWEARTAAVSIGEWKEAASKKGGARYAGGVQAGQGKMQNFMTEFIPHLNALDGVLSNMPSVTLEDGVARASAAIRHLGAFKRGR